MREVDRRLLFGETRGAVERIAPGYFGGRFEAEHTSRYRWAANYVRGSVVLDVAAGTGYGATLLRRAGAEGVVSMDISEPALRFGVQRHEIRAVVADAHLLPFRPRSFGAVVSLETIEHLADPRAFVREVRAVLEPGGLFILSTPNAMLSAGTNPYHLHEFQLEELREMLATEGLRIVQVRGQGWRLRPSLFRRVRGLRRLAWELESSTFVVGRVVSLADPRYLCIAARAGNE